jgi:oligopeptide transport system substrate-binding protein
MPSKSKLWLLLVGATAVLAAVLASACGDGGETKSSSGQMAPVQELRLNLVAEPETIDPNLAFDSDSIGVVRQLYSGLLAFDQDLNLVPALASEVPSQSNGGISADGLTYTFKLREDAKWSDGQPITAADVEYSVKRLLDPEIGSAYAPVYFDIQGAAEYTMAMGDPDDPTPVDEATLSQLRDTVGVEAVDEHTLRMTLVQPRYTFVYLAAIWPIYPLRQDIVEAFGDTWTEPGNNVSSGPFVLSEWAHNDHMTLTPNPYWYGEQPKLQKLVLKMIGDPNAAYAAYLNDELDVVAVPPANIKSVEEDSNLSQQIVRSVDMGTNAYEFNVQVAPFDDPKVRQAFAMAIDRDSFVNKVDFGVGEVAYSLIPPGTVGYDPELGQELAYDPQRARELLAEAGYGEGNVPDVTIQFADVGGNQLSAEFAQGQFEENLGVSVKLEPLEPRAFAATVMQGEFMIIPIGWGADYPDADSWLPQNFGSEGGSNLAGYSNAEFDALVEQAIAEPDPGKRLALWSQAQQLLVNDAAAIFVSYRERVRLVKPYVKNLILTGMDAGLDGELFLTATYIAEH